MELGVLRRRPVIDQRKAGLRLLPYAVVARPSPRGRFVFNQPAAAI